MKKTTLFLVFVFLLINFTLSSSLVAQELSDPELNFEAAWKSYDLNYGAFIPKKVDWDLLYRVYRPKVTPQTTDDELFDIISAMLKQLNDNHVSLRTETRRFGAGITSDLERGDFSLDLVKEKYLKGKLKQRVKSRRGNLIFTFGWITDEIGYFYFRNFSSRKESTAAVDEIVNEFKNAKGIIMDIRNNGGGSDLVAKAIGDRFADTKRLYMYSHIRNGPNHDDFTPPRYWHFEPDGPMQFLKPVIFLTNRFSISAADCFALGMRALPHVTNLGDATSGAYSDSMGETLPNGWSVRMGNKLYFDNEGRGWEGIGTPPDLRVVNTKEDIARGIDKVLELAIDILNSGPIALQDEPSSVLNAQESLADNLEKAINAAGIDSTVKLFDSEIKPRPSTIRPIEFDWTPSLTPYSSASASEATLRQSRFQAEKRPAYYIDIEEMNMLANRLKQQDKMREAIEVLKISVKVYPLEYRAYASLAEAYEKNADTELAKINYFKAMELNPRRSPREKQAYERAKELIKKKDDK